ncbi:hypothetical protein GCM10027168_26930 [Streptomyces capparidis]
MTYHLGPDVSATDTEEGLVLLDQRTGRYWQLNPSGAAVLRLVLAGNSPREAAEELVRRAPAAAPRAEADVAALLNALRAARLVVVS